MPISGDLGNGKPRRRKCVRRPAGRTRPTPCAQARRKTRLSPDLSAMRSRRGGFSARRVPWRNRARAPLRVRASAGRTAPASARAGSRLSQLPSAMPQRRRRFLRPSRKRCAAKLARMIHMTTAAWPSPRRTACWVLWPCACRTRSPRSNRRPQGERCVAWESRAVGWPRSSRRRRRRGSDGNYPVNSQRHAADITKEEFAPAPSSRPEIRVRRRGSGPQERHAGIDAAADRGERQQAAGNRRSLAAGDAVDPRP